MSRPHEVTVLLVGGPRAGTRITVPTDRNQLHLTVFTDDPESKHYTYEYMRFNGAYLGIGEDLEPRKLRTGEISLDLEAIPEALDWVKGRQARELLDWQAIPETILATVTPINVDTNRVKVVTTALTTAPRPSRTKEDEQP